MAVVSVQEPSAVDRDSLKRPSRMAGGRVLLERAVARIDIGVEVLLYIALFGELAVLFGNVVTRDIFGFSLTWSDEIGQLALTILAFVGGAFAYRQRVHGSLQVWVRRLPVEWQDAQTVFVALAIAAIALVVTVAGVPLLSSQWNTRTPVLNLPQTYYTIPILLGMVLLVVYALGELSRADMGAIVRGGTWFIAVAVIDYVACRLVRSWAPDSTTWPSIVSLASFVILLAMGMPVAFVLLIAGTLFLYASQTSPLNATVTNVSSGASDPLLLAIPFFIFAGIILTATGLSAKLLRFAHSIVGRARGGMLQTVVVTMYAFSGLSGSKVADVAAVGSPIAESIEEHGHTREELAAVLAVSAIMGEAVPPSIAMIILASVTNISVAGLFEAGIIPAAIIGVLLMAAIYVQARRTTQRGERIPYREIVRSAVPALPVLIVPALLLAGVVGGFASPTETSSIAVVIALVLALLYRVLSRENLRATLKNTVSVAGFVLFIIGCASHFSWSLTIAGLPTQIAHLFMHLGNSRLLILLVTVAVVPVLGSVLEGMPAVLIFAPILMPIAQAAGIDPLQYGVIFVIALGLGTFAPPLGVGLYATCSICRVRMEAVAKPLMRYWVVVAAGVVLLALIPGLSLVLPHHVFHTH